MISTPIPRLETVRVEVANLTCTQAAFLRGIIAILNENGPTLSQLERDRVQVRMDRRTGDVYVLPNAEPTIANN